MYYGGMEIITYADAKSLGLKRFFTGKPCKYGHIAERMIGSRNCCECNRLRNLASSMRPDQHEAQKSRNREAQRRRREDVTVREAERVRNAEYEQRRRSDLDKLAARRARDRERHRRMREAMTPEEKLEWGRRRRAMRDADPLQKASAIVRILTHKAFSRRRLKKGTKTAALLGCSWDEAKAQIERQFLRGMSWENFGEWHLDHITPLATAQTEEELAALCHISNLRPMWGSDNLAKGSNVQFLL